MDQSSELEVTLNRRELLGGAGAVALLSISSRNSWAADQSVDLELCYMPATEQLKRFRAKQLSPVDVLRAQLTRYEATEEQLNNFIEIYPDEAMQAARASEDRYMKGEPLPLDGITCATKDELAIEGRPLTAGSKVLAGHLADHNDVLAERLLADGAILHGITTVPEMYFAAVTWSDLWGVTRNPWNTDYTVGGSSGGSAGALATGQTTLATGSDMGGSIRIPASVCGLYGFKPPYGRIPASPGATFLLPSTSGPLARTLQDMILLENNMAGPTPKSLTAIRPKLELPLSYHNVEGMKIGFVVDQGWAEVDPEIQALFMESVTALRNQGALVEEIDLELGLTGPQIRAALVKALLSGAFGGQLGELNDYADQLTTYGRYFAKVAATGMGPNEAMEAADIQEALHDKVQNTVFTKGLSALLMPTTNTSRIPADFDPTQDVLEINDQIVDPHVGWIQTPLWNLLNWYPVLNVPIGVTSDNMPAGMQIIANTFDDHTCMQVAAAHVNEFSPLYTEDRIPLAG